MQDRYWSLNTFGEIPDPWAAEIASRGWGRVRVEGTDYAAVMAQCQRHELWPLWILDRGEHLTCPSGIDVEIGNECNDGCAREPGRAPWPKLSPADYAAWVLEAWPTLLAAGCTVYCGAANNTSVPGLAWTREVLARLPFHPQLRVSFHRYPMNGTNQRPDVPQKGHHSMAAEDAAILDCVRGRRWAITEAGLVDATYRDWGSWKYFGKKRATTAVDGHRWQAARFQRMGADFYCVYQLNSSATEHYGVRRLDGTWTASAALPSLL